MTVFFTGAPRMILLDPEVFQAGLHNQYRMGPVIILDFPGLRVIVNMYKNLEGPII